MSAKRNAGIAAAVILGIVLALIGTQFIGDAAGFNFTVFPWLPHNHKTVNWPGAHGGKACVICGGHPSAQSNGTSGGAHNSTVGPINRNTTDENGTLPIPPTPPPIHPGNASTPASPPVPTPAPAPAPDPTPPTPTPSPAPSPWPPSCKHPHVSSGTIIRSGGFTHCGFFGRECGSKIPTHIGTHAVPCTGPIPTPSPTPVPAPSPHITPAPTPPPAKPQLHFTCNSARTAFDPYYGRRVTVYISSPGEEGTRALCQAMTDVMRDVQAVEIPGAIPPSAPAGGKLIAAYKAWAMMSPTCVQQMGTRAVDWAAMADYAWLSNNCQNLGFKYPTPPIPTADDLIFRPNYTVSCGYSLPISNIDRTYNFGTTGTGQFIAFRLSLGPMWPSQQCSYMAGLLRDAALGNIAPLRTFGNDIHAWGLEQGFDPVNDHPGDDGQRCKSDFDVLQQTSGDATRLRDIMTAAFFTSACNMTYYDNTTLPAEAQPAPTNRKFTNTSDVGYMVLCNPTRQISECLIDVFTGYGDSCEKSWPRYRVILQPNVEWIDGRKVGQTQALDFKSCYYIWAAYQTYEKFNVRDMMDKFLYFPDRTYGIGCPTKIAGRSLVTSSDFETQKKLWPYLLQMSYKNGWTPGTSGGHCESVFNMPLLPTFPDKFANF